jgi:hypothetical protein
VAAEGTGEAAAIELDPREHLGITTSVDGRQSPLATFIDYRVTG